VLQDHPREYEVLVYDDGSTDATVATLEPYHKVMPLTVLGGRRIGYAGAIDALCREASRRTRYPRRDAIIILQADFTDQPEHLPELIKRFEGGADIVIGERSNIATEPDSVRKLRKFAPWAIRFSVGTSELADPFGSFKLIRISLIRDILKAAPETPIVTANGWAANLQLLLATMPLARRVERVELAPRYDLRVRASRIQPLADWMSLYRFGRTMRGKRLAMPAPAEQPAPGARAPKKKVQATS
jgi:glycosyltransferase involved in cell wall biosynthesis